MKRIVVATRNAKKLRELKKYLRPLTAEVVSLKEVPAVPHVREDGTTFEANARKKAVAISRFTHGLVLADDSGLEVDALGGAPGIKSARFAGPRKSDHDNNEKILQCLEGVPPAKRTARFVCAIAIADRGHVVATIEEYCTGRIAFALRGQYGFGYDPLFLIPSRGKTFGELGPKVKDRMSHRAKALRKAVRFLKRYIGPREDSLSPGGGEG